MRPESWSRLAGVSPVRVGTGAPGSRPRFVVERRRAERGVECLFGGRPARRVDIPKPDGGRRPLGIPAVRGRVAQQAAKIVLEPIFEADFLPCSFGFRPRRSAVMAMERRRTGFIAGNCFVVEFGIRNFFGEISHERLLAEVGRRVRYADDGVVLCRGAAQARAALDAVGEILGSLGLRLDPGKTKVVDLREGREGLDFLGCHFRARMSGRLWERTSAR